MIELASIIREAGIVGAGGGGFPTHVKVAARVDTVIANGAECEPLLRCDKAVMQRAPRDVLRGLAYVAEATGATRAVLALKGHYGDVVRAVKAEAVGFPNIEVFELGNYYPAGDEQVLVHEVTGRVVPEGGIPLAVGCVVSNIVTLAQIARAVERGEPVTSRPVTIVGDVRRPCTLTLPIGTTIGDAVAMAGGATVDDPVYIDGGPMMGAVTRDADAPLTKRSSGLLVLSARHPLAQQKMAPITRELNIGRSVCCSCRMCTDLCPRFLLGHELEPHATMRAIKHSGLVEGPERHITNAWLCCLCGMCEIACPLQLSPRKVNDMLRQEMGKAGIKNPHKRAPERARDEAEGRAIPVPRLVARLGLSAYAKQGWDVRLEPQPVDRVRIPLSQHIGAPALPIVAQGQAVRRGDLLGEIPDGKLGARVHASITGVVTRLDQRFIEITVTGSPA